MIRLLVRILLAPLRLFVSIWRLATFGRRATRGPRRALRTVRRVGRALR
jgi:hypothetical protein